MSIRITMIGTGYVGLVSGACFSHLGVDVTCLDIDEEKIARLKAGEIPIYEPGLGRLVREGVDAGRLSFTTDAKSAIADRDAIFIAVGTPTNPENGHASMEFVHAAARGVAEHLTGYTVIVDKSTVPVGTAREVHQIISESGQEGTFDVVSNPEFLREGAAIDDFLRPDRVVIGTDSEKAKNIMRRLYSPLSDNGVPIMFTNQETAELIKYAANAFLATKISFINEVANLCEKVGADVDDVARGVGMDSRIGGRFLQTGPGYGGSCFPKDTLALAKTGEETGARQKIVETVIASNEARKKHMSERIAHAVSPDANGDVRGKNIALLGVTFKAETDDMRDSPALDIVPALQEKGAIIHAYDPQGQEAASKLLQNIRWADSPENAVKASDGVAILTEWNEFRHLDWRQMAVTMNNPVIVDLRNLYDPESFKNIDVVYVSLGRRIIGDAK